LFSSDSFLVLDEKDNVINKNLIQGKDDRVAKIKFQDLLRMLNDLEITYEQLFEFFSKLKNKSNFYQNHMMLFNMRQITLDSRKEKHTEKVKCLIAKNYHNFEDLCKRNLKFKGFYEKNKNTLVRDSKLRISDIELKVPTHIHEFYQKCDVVLHTFKNAFNSIISK